MWDLQRRDFQMFNIRRTGVAALLGGAIAICGATAGYATPSLTTQAQIFFGNDSDPSSPGIYNDSVIDPHSSSTGAAVNSQYSGSFTGQNSGGNSQTMQVDATGQANASFGQLKASSTLHLTTPFANTTANAPYTNPDFTSNTSGIPDFFQSSGAAIMRDTLSLQSSTSVSMLRLTFHLDGTITDNNLGSAMSSIVSISNPDTFANYYLSATPGNLDTLVNVDLDVTDSNAIEVALRLMTSSSAFLNIGGYSETGSYVLDADFYETLELTGITGFDDAGNEVTLNGLMGTSGTNYLALVGVTPPTSGVPEPATMTLFCAGLAGLWSRRRISRK